jgi:hypothetical protein
MPLLQPNQIGIREELADYIANADAKSTPLTSMAPKGKDIGNMTFSWQVDNYSSPVMGGVVDGTDVTVSSASNPVANRTRLYNYAQAFRRDLRVGFIAETQNVAGVSDELANGVAKKLVELKRDMEATFACTNQTAQADDGTNAYLTASLGKWLTATGSAGTVGVPTSTFAPSSGAVDTTASASQTETTIQAVLTAIYGGTGVIRDYDCIVGTTLKRAFTNLTVGALSGTGNNTNNVSATTVRTFNMEVDSTYSSSIDIFEGDFGRLILHPSTFIGGKNSTSLTAQAYKGYVIPMEYVEVRYAKLPEVLNLPNAGGGPAKLVQAIAGLVVKNPVGFGMFNGAS